MISQINWIPSLFLLSFFFFRIKRRKDKTLMESAHCHPSPLSHSITIKTKLQKPIQILFLFSLISCTILFFTSFATNNAPLPISSSSSSSSHPCSSAAADHICCDQTNYHSDICFLRGDIRADPLSSSIILHSSSASPASFTIQPYTRKWETYLKDKIQRLHLRVAGPDHPKRTCDVHHDVPGVFFSAGGYTGNVFHDFNDGIIPIYITSRHLDRRVVLGVLQYHEWWYSRYREIIGHLSQFPLVDFSNDTRTHCFSEAIVGLRFHGMLEIDPSQAPNMNVSVPDFHRLLDDSYRPGIQTQEANKASDKKPKLALLSRRKTRAIENEAELVQLAEDIGFLVELLRPESAELSRIYKTLNSSDVLVGVHGAALTHLLFMRPESVMVQIVPLGVDDVASSCYGEPAMRMGLKYVEYKIMPRESTLHAKYGGDDEVVKDPERVVKKGWKVTKALYLGGQNVTLDLHRFGATLVSSLHHVISRRNASLEF